MSPNGLERFVLCFAVYMFTYIPGNPTHIRLPIEQRQEQPKRKARARPKPAAQSAASTNVVHEDPIHELAVNNWQKLYEKAHHVNQLCLLGTQLTQYAKSYRRLGLERWNQGALVQINFSYHGGETTVGADTKLFSIKKIYDIYTKAHDLYNRVTDLFVLFTAIIAWIWSNKKNAGFAAAGAGFSYTFNTYSTNVTVVEEKKEEDSRAPAEAPKPLYLQ